MEGMQIAAFAVVKLDKESYSSYKIATANLDLMFYKDNLPRFLIGRQLCVCACMFIAARCFTIDKDHPEVRAVLRSGSLHTYKQYTQSSTSKLPLRFSLFQIFAGETSFEASPGFQDFINTGLLGAVVTTMLGCLIWRIIASSYPLLFMSNPIIYLTIKLCLAIEFSGLCSASWVLGKIHKDIVDYQPDAVRLEGAPKQVTRRDKDIDFTIDFIKYGYSLAALAFSVTIIMAAIGTDQTNAADNNIPAGVAIPLMCFLLLWLSMIEGGQGALVGLQPTPKDQVSVSESLRIRPVNVPLAKQ